VKRWKELRARIHADVCNKGYSREQQCFVQSYGSKELDAGLLLMPAVGFLPPSDGRIGRTVEAIEHGLCADGLVLRYDTRTADDGLPPGEGAFLACSFWLADALLLIGRPQDASLLALRNDVGLLAEEYDMRERRMLGNFAQAFSCVALVNTAYNLAAARTSRDPEERAVGTEEAGSS
jgi:GH15 family glucan-1,4-alpha-glucosidase